MTFSRPVEEIIRMRHSVRSYTLDKIPSEKLEKIFAYIKSVDNLFQGEVSIYLVNKDNLPANVKLGTYGMIRGGNYYLIGVSGDKDKDKLSLGYMLEKVVLYLTDLGLGSVWLGGTFNQSDFENAVSILGKHKVRVVLPFGYEGTNKTLLGKIAGISSNKRKDFKEVFFDGYTGYPVDPEDAGIFQLPLEMLRLAPSAINKQPWACGLRKNEMDFYVVEENDFSLIDMGICLAHFLMTLEDMNIKGNFVEAEESKFAKGKYIGTYKIQESL